MEVVCKTIMLLDIWEFYNLEFILKDWISFQEIGPPPFLSTIVEKPKTEWSKEEAREDLEHSLQVSFTFDGSIKRKTTIKQTYIYHTTSLGPGDEYRARQVWACVQVPWSNWLDTAWRRA